VVQEALEKTDSVGADHVWFTPTNIHSAGPRRTNSQIKTLAPQTLWNALKEGRKGATWCQHSRRILAWGRDDDALGSAL